ncbi:uncharacterized protein LOC125242333 [Leguminivora glycinivorella]|uniref:uncharacterized protein LOC125233852 n=1 Tax=Leguminivora glycinivorella TaxID=1035111 RepID=UPI00200EAC5F|nr:uncharacterized protein LOC125233852 [Leguminivora glycinivorella]XP_048007067.1 uncharacterized protein LOC125242333 [Leguminivora glycinivorella]
MLATNLVLGNSLVFDHRTQEWAIFKSRFTQFCLANKFTEETDKSGATRRAILLSALVEDTFRIAKDLVSPDNLDSIGYTDLIAKLDGHFEAKRCVFAERYLFYKAEQRPGEELSDWAARVRSLAQYCSFTTELDSALRDRFVLGLENRKEKEKLFAEDPTSLTFSKALQLAQSVRCARLAVHGNSGTASAGAGTSTGVFAMRPAAESDKKKTKCSACGYHGHSKDQCKFTQYSCKKCGKKGHLSRVCKSKVKATNFLAEDTDDICEDLTA